MSQKEEEQSADPDLNIADSNFESFNEKEESEQKNEKEIAIKQSLHKENYRIYVIIKQISKTQPRLYRNVSKCQLDAGRSANANSTQQ